MSGLRSPAVGQGRSLSRSNNGLKGHGLGPGLARGVLHFGGHLGFADAGTDGFERPVEQGWRPDRPRIEGRQSLPRPSPCGPARPGPGPRADGDPRAAAPASRDRAATVMCSPSIPILSREARRPFFCCDTGQPRGGCRQRPFASDHDLRRLHFGSRLLGIAPIGKEHCFFPVITRTPALPVNPQR